MLSTELNAVGDISKSFEFGLEMIRKILQIRQIQNDIFRIFRIVSVK